MGFFTRHHRSASPAPPVPQLVDEKIYVFIRASDISSAAKITWSLALLQSERPPPMRSTSSDESSQHSKQKKSLFSFATRRDSGIDVDPRNQIPPPPTPSRPLLRPTVHEFGLSPSGRLTMTKHTTASSGAHYVPTLATATPKSRSRSRHPVAQPTTDPEPILLQFLLPQSTHPVTSNPLIPQIQTALQSVTTSNSQFTIPSTTWLKLALIALQSENILPSTGLDAEKFMAFARNAFTGFEGECLGLRLSQGTVISGGAISAGSGMTLAASNNVVNLKARHTKVIDYAGHVQENERLSRLFKSGAYERNSVVLVEERLGWLKGCRSVNVNMAGLVGRCLYRRRFGKNAKWKRSSYTGLK